MPPPGGGPAAPRSPMLAHGPDFRLSGLAAQVVPPAQDLLQPAIAGRHHVAVAEAAHQHVLGGPATNALEPRQLGDRCLVVELRERVEIEGAVADCPRGTNRVLGLLAAELERSQRRWLQAGQQLWL